MSLDQAQVSLAVRALLKHSQLQSRAKSSGRQQLLGDAVGTISLIVGMKTTPDPSGQANKPRGVPLPHSLYDDEDFEVCLIVKDGCAGDVVERIEASAEASSSSLEAGALACVTKVLTLSKLRAEHNQHEQRRLLCSSYDLFLVDERILPMMPKALGKIFYVKKMQPVPVRIARRGAIVSTGALGGAVTRARNSTFVHLGAGSCCAVKVAKTDFDANDIVENVVAAATTTIEKYVPRRWHNVMSLHIKTQDSIALPIYNALEDEAVAALLATRKQAQDAKRKRSAKSAEEASPPKRRKAKGGKAAAPKAAAPKAAAPKAAKKVKSSTKKVKSSTKKKKAKK